VVQRWTKVKMLIVNFWVNNTFNTCNLFKSLTWSVQNSIAFMLLYYICINTQMLDHSAKNALINPLTCDCVISSRGSKCSVQSMLKYFTVRRKLFWQLGPQPKNLQSCSHKHLQAKQMTCTMRNCSQCQSRNSPHKLLSEASWGSSLLWAIWADTQRLSPCCCHPYVLLADHMLQLHTTHKIAAKTGGKETTELVASFAFKSLLTLEVFSIRLYEIM